jgi:hypothetical protein
MIVIVHQAIDMSVLSEPIYYLSICYMHKEDEKLGPSPSSATMSCGALPRLVTW